MKYKASNNVYAFIDGTNLYLSIKEQGWQLHYKRFRKFLSDKFGVTKVFYFIGYAHNQRNLYESLRKSGYKLRFKPTSRDNKGQMKGNVDAELILTALVQYPHYDQAVIVAGDGDYYCLAKYLRRKRKLLGILIPDKNNYSWLLTRFVPYLVFMSGMRNKLEYRGPKRK